MMKRCIFYAVSMGIIVIFGCTHQTKPQTAQVSGKVVLVNDLGDHKLDPPDFMGVTVAIYNLTVLDSVIVQVNQQEPQIGVLIDQMTEFDHRYYAPVAITQTAADGSFLLTDIEYGTYNVVFFKVGWGYRYEYNCELNAHEVVINDGATIQLFPERKLGGYLTTDYSLQADRVYHVESDLSVIGGLLIESGSKLMIDPGVSVNVYGTLSQLHNTDDPARISSAAEIYSIPSSSKATISKFNSFYLRESSSINGNILQNIILSHSTDGIFVGINGITIQNSIFRRCLSAVNLSNVDDIIINKTILDSCGGEEAPGLFIYSANNSSVQGLIAVNNTTALKQHSSNAANVTNSWFQANSQADIMNLYETIGSVTHCEFRKSNIAIDTSGRSRTTITYCNINAKIGIFNYIQLNWFASWFTANYNNFYCTEYAAKTRAVFYSSSPTHLDGKNNYWNTSSSTAIADMIWDLNDEDPNDPDYYILMGVIDYTPFRTAKVQNAGISP